MPERVQLEPGLRHDLTLVGNDWIKVLVAIVGSLSLHGVVAEDLAGGDHFHGEDGLVQRGPLHVLEVLRDESLLLLGAEADADLFVDFLPEVLHPRG